MANKILIYVFVCVFVSGLTSCDQHRTPKKISFVSSKNSEHNNGEDTMSNQHNQRNVEEDICTLSLQNIVKGTPSYNLNLEHTGFFVSYNTTLCTPSWVAWELTSSETNGPISRKGYDYMPDPLIDEQYQVQKSDYKNSGYDKGHMCPAGDMEWSADAMNDCHYMTNICPQSKKLNQNYWEKLESACRRWANREGSIYIVCGPIYSSSTTKFGSSNTISVPYAFFKIVLSLNKGYEKGIGFIYFNSNDKQTMEGAATTINKVEEITGYDFFSELPDELEDKLECQCNLRGWN